MKDYLVFRLYGPLVSWGNIAVGEYRPSDSFPTKSAIIGLISASFGFDRSEDGKISELVKSVFFATKTLNPGNLLRDYHTIQTPETLNGLYLLERTNFWIRSTSRLFFRAEIIEWTPFTT